MLCFVINVTQAIKDTSLRLLDLKCKISVCSRGNVTLLSGHSPEYCCLQPGSKVWAGQILMQMEQTLNKNNERQHHILFQDIHNIHN